MKKRWFVTALFAMVLCVGAVSAQAAVVSGGVEYLWTTNSGGPIWGEDSAEKAVGYQGQRFFLSADGGASYAELPGLREQSEKVWGDYRLRVLPLEGGGLRLEGWGQWETEVTWTRDYTAAELAAALQNTVATPIRVWGTNGSVSIATREVRSNGNDDPARAPWDYSEFWGDPRAGDHLLYSTDGVTWQEAEMAEGVKELDYNYFSFWWDGEMFWGEGGQCSADGIHWTQSEKEDLVSPKLRYSCELGDYHFEVVNTSDWQNGNDVYLMRRSAVDMGVLLPDLGNAIRAMGIGVGDVQAWYTPNDTITVAFYDFNQGEGYMYSLNYPISSLEWCLDNLSVKFRDVEVKAVSGELGTPGVIALGVITASNDGYFREQGELIRYTSESGGWQKVPNVPWGRAIKVLPYNGKTFMVQDMVSRKLYASPNGISWSEVSALWPQDPEFSGTDYDYLEYAVAWSGRDYIACRKAAVRRHGMMGHAGGHWYDGNTRVYFLNEALELLSSYDFGRLVEKIGFLNGAYYAQVSNSERTSDTGFDWGGEGCVLYRSTDGKSWEKLPDIYIDYEDIMISTKGGSGVGNRPTGDPNKPQHSIARLDRWRFVLDEYFAWDFERNVREDHPTYRVCLMGDSAADWVELPHLGEAIKAQGVEPWELSAAYNPDGTVEVKVTDKNDANKYISISYPTSSLDWVKENLMGINGRELPQYSGTNNDAWDIESKYGVADLIAVELANGESEIVYRSEATGGQWKWYDSAPWSGFVELLPFSGKDFMVLDKADGKVYLSSDGVSWREATGNWIVRNQAHNYWEYAFVWTGEHYLGVCTLADDVGEEGKYRTWSEKSYQAVLLDENLNQVRAAADFGDDTTAVGYRDGVGYVEIMRAGLNRSTDGGKTWEVTDVMQVRDALVGLQ